jgi:membrane fusion protein (multidrug efflux system)
LLRNKRLSKILTRVALINIYFLVTFVLKQECTASIGNLKSSILGVFFFLLVLSVTSCTDDNRNSTERLETNEPDSAIIQVVPKVNTEFIKRGTFKMSTVANGVISASGQIILSFQISGILKSLNVKNGSNIREGNIIAEVSHVDEDIRLREANLRLQESIFQINDLLISLGGRQGDTNSVAKDILAYIRIKSGYKRALIDIDKANHDIEKCILRAPVNGTIANLYSTKGASVSSASPFCILVNRDNLVVKTSIMETEISNTKRGQSVRILPLAVPNKIYRGTVMESNPIISSGLQEIIIKVLDPDFRLLPGMFVKVFIDRNAQQQTIVSKKAVVDRNGKKVVFTYENGYAKWNDVKLGLENETQVTIDSGLSGNAQVIVSGNLNLGQGAKVDIDNK